ncbi:nucleotidyltransferase family protein [Caulobacter sp. FWC2]|uniref:nucleotidyltransferase domain-containing protein n=1 Tax=Caulobacter sp. FWC2 TaxID=69664 RepID=UPI0013044509|nr:nucleotidyltransferase family protein [Caulobacter sp. FWC2]
MNDPAFDLARACAAWPPSSHGDRAIVAAARLVDWPGFLAVARRHRITALAWTALVRTGVAPPPEVAGALSEAADQAARREGLMALESARLQHLLDRAGLANQVLKGATLSALAYGRDGVKQSLDIDLLVLPEDVSAASEALTKAGYVRIAPSPDLDPARLAVAIALTREAVFRRPQDGLLVELQWRADINPLWLPGVDARSASQTARLPGWPPLRTLGPEALYPYLCAHGARHGFMRLKWLADIVALLHRAGPEDLDRLHAHAVTLGVGRASALSLRLGQRVLGLSIPDELDQRLPRVRWLVALCLDLIAGAGAREAETRPLHLYRLALLQLLLNNRGDQLVAELKLRLVSPRDRIALALPPWASLAYPLLRLPLFLARRFAALRAR